MRQSRANERRKSVVSKGSHPAAIGKPRMVGMAEPEPTSIKQQPSSNDAAYSLSLDTEPTVPAGPDNTSKEILHQDHLLANTKLLRSGAMPEQQAIFVRFENDMLVWPAMLLSSIVGIGMMTIFTKQARALSRWSKENKVKARSILVLAKMGTCIGCFSLGDALYNSGFIVPELLRIPTLVVFASALAFYPSKYFASGFPAFSFLERKFYDATIFAAGAIVMLYAGNRLDVSLHRGHLVQTTTHVALPADGFNLESKVISITKKEFMQRVKIILQDKPKELTKGTKAALTILAVLAGIALTFGVTALSCSIACSGAEVASVLVFAGGMSLIILGLVSTIKSIHRRPTKKRQTDVRSVA